MGNFENKKWSRCCVIKEVRNENFKKIGKTDETLKWSALCKGCLYHKQNKVLINQLENDKYFKELLKSPKLMEYIDAEKRTAKDQGKIKAQETIEKLSKEFKKSTHEYTEMNLRHQNAQETITELRKENSELRKEISDNLIKIMKHLNVEANSF